MPNWCINKLEVIGTVPAVSAFLDRCRENKNNLFASFLPHPEPQGAWYREHWYDWNSNTWGTKWESHDVVLPDNISPLEIIAAQDDEMAEEIEFNSAWGPPHPVVYEIDKQYPDLFFIHKWRVEGGNGVGESQFENGEMLFQEYCSETTERGRDLMLEVAGYDLSEIEAEE